MIVKYKMDSFFREIISDRYKCVYEHSLSVWTNKELNVWNTFKSMGVALRILWFLLVYLNIWTVSVKAERKMQIGIRNTK